jgi:hypothetical protein
LVAAAGDPLWSVVRLDPRVISSDGVKKGCGASRAFLPVAEDGQLPLYLNKPRAQWIGHFLSNRWMAVFRGSPRVVVFVSVKYRVQ